MKKLSTSSLSSSYESCSVSWSMWWFWQNHESGPLLQQM